MNTDGAVGHRLRELCLPRTVRVLCVCPKSGAVSQQTAMTELPGVTWDTMENVPGKVLQKACLFVRLITDVSGFFL